MFAWPICAVMTAGSWVVFIVSWLVNAPKTKQDVTRQSSWLTALAMRLVIPVAVILLLRAPGGRQRLQGSRVLFSYSVPTFAMVGAALCVVGTATAVWARGCLGADWSSRPSLKADHVLVTSGPHHLIRHPNCAGMHLAAPGTAVDAGITGLVILVVAAAVLIRRILVGEKLMMGLSQGQYPS
jgi:protein-S-isoprenylcysteine O-methyltransferase Ste14